MKILIKKWTIAIWKILLKQLKNGLFCKKIRLECVIGLKLVLRVRNCLHENVLGPLIGKKLYNQTFQSARNKNPKLLFTQ